MLHYVFNHFNYLCVITLFIDQNYKKKVFKGFDYEKASITAFDHFFPSNYLVSVYFPAFSVIE